MTQEEAINIVKTTKYYSEKNYPEFREALGVLVPELYESEDERIRKEILEFFINYHENGTWKAIKDSTRWINYLEKQKEPLHIPETCKENANSFTSKDERIRNQLINICNEWLRGKYSARPCLNNVRWLKNLLEKQKEIKFSVPGLYYYDGEKVHYYGSPATEENLEKQDVDFSTNDTSKNDARKRRQIIALLSASKGKCMASFAKDIDECVAYLIERQKEQKPTSFDEPYNPDEYEVVMEGNATSLKRKEQKPVEYPMTPNECYKPVEWSEEDQKLIRLIISILEDKHPNGFWRSNEMESGVYTKELVDFLKRLRPSWKPSEEQIELLEKLSNHGGHYNYQNLGLKKLVTQLREL